MINQTYLDIFNNDEKLTTLVKEILDVGYVAMDDFLDLETKAAFHQAAADRSNAGKKNEELKGTPIYELGHSPLMLEISQKIYDKRCELTGEPKVTLKPEDQFVGMPYKDSREGAQNKETAYHYDGAYSNWLFPLFCRLTKVKEMATW